MQLPFTPRAHTSGIDVVALGENSLDFVAVTDATRVAGSKQPLSAFRLQPGGQMATAAIACARLGARTRYVGAFGTDEWSARARAPLDAAGVDVVAIERTGVAGRVAVILVDATGDRTVFECRDAALTIAADEMSAARIEQAKVLLVDATHVEAAVHAARRARAAGTISIVDVDRPSPAVDRLLDEIDVAIMPESFVREWTGAADLRDGLVRAAARCTRAGLVVATRGEAGSTTYCGGHFVDVPACNVPVVDTTGAGDAFRAGFAVALLDDGRASLEEVLRFATAVAGLNCRAIGAQAGLPTRDEVRAICRV